MARPETALRPGDALLMVDVQVDFCPGGALAIDEGDVVIPLLNAWSTAVAARGLPVYASRDWHPVEHPSFAATGGPWPRHCLQDEPGAAFHPLLTLPAGTTVVSKGTRFDQDQNSAFEHTGLIADMRRRGVRRLWLGGLALDVCVLATALDARAAGLDVHLLLAATRPVTADGGRAALQQMRGAGVVIDDDA